MTFELNNILLTPYANSVDIYNPALWALESLRVLYENMVAARLVHRGFSEVVAKYGDTVNTRRPQIVKAGRKGPNDSVVNTDIAADPVQIVLNQQLYSSITILDRQQALSIKDLATEFIGPQMIGMARQIDRIILGQYARIFRASRVGQLGGLTSSNARTTILAARQKLNNQLAPEDNRSAIWGSGAESTLLNTDLFLQYLQRGSTEGVLNAQLKHLLGIEHYMDQNMAFVDSTYTKVVAGTITSAQAKGATGSLGCTVTSTNVTVGSWVTIAGDMNPQEVTARTYSSDTTAITLSQPLDNATGAGAVLTYYSPFAVSGAQALGYQKQILITGSSGYPPQVGQLLSFGTTAAGTRYDYVIIDVVAASSTSWNVYLDRPLERAIADSDPAFPGPAGGFNLVLHPNAIGFISRPLPSVPEGLGARSAIMNYNGVGLRVVLNYDAVAQGTRVTTDLLAGIQILDNNLATVVLT